MYCQSSRQQSKRKEQISQNAKNKKISGHLAGNISESGPRPIPSKCSDMLSLIPNCKLSYALF